MKPIPPMEYDGTPDPHKYHRFVTEGMAYVEDGNVDLEKRAFVLSHYLTDTAHDFYVHEVSKDPYNWELSDFFTELFNYCFPVNFRLRQREKLQNCYQGSKTVKRYLYELNELWSMIGETNEQTKVNKPEVSSLKTVAATAEICREFTCFSRRA